MKLLAAGLCYLALGLPAFAECSGRMITGKVYAPVCVPANPQRVAILDPFYNLGMALELELPVAAAPLLGAKDGGLRTDKRAGSIVDLGDFRQPSLERLIALQPDLIVGNASTHANLHAAASRIAPTLLFDDPDWKAHLRLLARATGRDAAAETLLAAYEERAVAIRERAHGMRVSVIRIAANGFIAYPDGPDAFGPYAVLREVGVKRTAIETVSDSTPFKRLDWEELIALDGDVLLYFALDGADPAHYDRVEAETVANPLWQMIPAVRAGRAYRVDPETWWRFNGVGSAHSTLDDIERFILNTP